VLLPYNQVGAPVAPVMGCKADVVATGGCCLWWAAMVMEEEEPSTLLRVGGGVSLVEL